MTGELFGNREVSAQSVGDFLDRYYKPDRYTGRGEEYASHLLASYESDFTSRGFVIISHHDSVTGEVVAYFGPSEMPKSIVAELIEACELGLACAEWMADATDSDPEDIECADTIRAAIAKAKGE